MARGVAAPHVLRGRETEKKCMALRKKGLSYAAIGEALGISEMGALKAVRRGMDRLMKMIEVDADKVRSLELERLDAMLAAIWDACDGSRDPETGEQRPVSLKAINTALNIMKRRSELLGLDAPKKVEVEDVTDIDRQIAGLVERLKPSGQVPVTVEIDCTTQPVDPPRELVLLGDNGGSRIREDAIPGYTDTDTDRLDDHGGTPARG